MNKPKFWIPLKSTESIRAAYAERASGPGWANSPVSIVIYDSATNRYREETIQPRDYMADDAMTALFTVCAVAHESLMSAVQRYVDRL